MVFDMAMNPPAMKQPTLQWLLASSVTPGASTGYDPTVGLSPTEYAWTVPTVYQWNIGVQWKMPADFGPRRILRRVHVEAPAPGQPAQRRCPTAPRTCPSTRTDQGPDLLGCSGLSSTPGGNALPTDLMRPYQGFGGIRMYEFKSYGDYKALQTTVSRRFAKGSCST